MSEPGHVFWVVESHLYGLDLTSEKSSLKNVDRLRLEDAPVLAEFELGDELCRFFGVAGCDVEILFKCRVDGDDYLGPALQEQPYAGLRFFFSVVDIK